MYIVLNKQKINLANLNPKIPYFSRNESKITILILGKS